MLRDEASFRAPALAQLDRFFDAGGALWIFVDGSAAQIDWLQQHGVRVTRPYSGRRAVASAGLGSRASGSRGVRRSKPAAAAGGGILSRLQSCRRPARARGELAGRKNGDGGMEQRRTPPAARRVSAGSRGDGLADTAVIRAVCASAPCAGSVRSRKRTPTGAWATRFRCPPTPGIWRASGGTGPQKRTDCGRQRAAGDAGPL